MVDENRETIAKYKKKTDQLITMHSVLSQRYSRYSTESGVVIWIGSAVLLSMTWFDPALIKLLPIEVDESGLRLWLGLVSLLIFVASLLPLLLQWKDKASAHNAAAKALAELKFCLREAEKVDGSKTTNEVISQYSRVMEGICEIPEQEFLKLKQTHLRKVAFSKFQDMNPGRLYLMNNICFFIANIGCKTETNSENDRKPDIS